MIGEFAKERYISLTTFKRDGTPVSTPVWVVTDNGRRLLILSGVKTWKVRRLRRDPNVLIAASNYRGRERGSRLAAHARLIPDPGIQMLLRRKYGWQKRVLDLLNGKAAPEAWVTIEILDLPVAPAAAADAGEAGIGGGLKVAAAGLEPATRGL